MRLRALQQPEVYQAGLQLFVYLVRKFGVEQFVAYYRQARDTADPDQFQQDFESFWGIALDTTWEEMQRSRKANGRVYAICPCTQRGILPLDGRPVDFATVDLNAIPLPAEDPGPYLFSAEVSAVLKNCTQDYVSFNVANLPAKPAGITAARLLPERHYFAVDARGALSGRKGNFVGAACAETEVIALPNGYFGAADILVARGADDPLTTDWYARFSWGSEPRVVRVRPPVGFATTALEVCQSCDATGGPCTQIVAAGGEVELTLPGPELVLHATYTLLPEGIGSSTVSFLPP